MIETILFIITSFGVGLSGAIVPGPMLTVTISDSVKNGFFAGPLIVLGHIITELALIIAILAGLGWIIGSPTAIFIIGMVGGSVLIFIGYKTSRSNEKLSDIISNDDSSDRYGPFFGGVITSVSNPYFFIWWATIGFAFMLKGFELAGVLGLLGFLIGHWSADLSWFSIVSFFSSKGSKIMDDKTYKLVMMICGLFLAILGFYFVISQINFLDIL